MKKRLLLAVALPVVIGGLLLAARITPQTGPSLVRSGETASGTRSQEPTSAIAAHSASTQTRHESAANPTPATTAPVTRPDTGATVTANEIITADGRRYPLREYKTLTYTDPKAAQWWTGTAKLQALWDAGAGTYVPTIAIIDTGFALGHEEFTGRWALNAADPVNGVDDDGNGYVDDWRGWDFADDDNSPQAGEVDPNGDGTMHGSMTAGAAAATGGNGKGIAGASQTSMILPVQVMDDDSNGNSYTVGRGVIYAADRHADVISISLGTDADDPYLHAAIDYAIAKGSIVVASAGNGGETSNTALAYPAAYPEVVAVGSIGLAGTPSIFSSHGDNLDILAPGEDMTLPAWGPGFATNGYVRGAAGTSFSAPLVAGTLAQLKAFSPSSTGGELIAAIKETADHKTLTTTAPRSATLGYGVLDAGAAAIRLTSGAASSVRMLYGAVAGDTLSSVRAYACQGTFPSAELLEIDSGGGKPSRYTYTISETDAATARSAGRTVRSLGYQCVG